MSHRRTSSRLRLAFYGDDFTGSTDALEVLAFSGLRCALFLSVPTPERMEVLGAFDAIGVAGASRAMSPDEMSAQLAPVLAAMSRLPVAQVHYKVCSTFDSSPAIGSIGRVMDLSRAAFGDSAIPIVGGHPGTRPLLRLRQPVRPLGHRRARASHRSPPHHERAPGDADARGRPGAAPRRADRDADRRLHAAAVRAGSRGHGGGVGSPGRLHEGRRGAARWHDHRAAHRDRPSARGACTRAARRRCSASVVRGLE
jgi:hypothetical protein